MVGSTNRCEDRGVSGHSFWLLILGQSFAAILVDGNPLNLSCCYLTSISLLSRDVL